MLKITFLGAEGGPKENKSQLNYRCDKSKIHTKYVLGHWGIKNACCLFYFRYDQLFQYLSSVIEDFK